MISKYSIGIRIVLNILLLIGLFLNFLEGCEKKDKENKKMF
mgnify:CR=1 FL=1